MQLTLTKTTAQKITAETRDGAGVLIGRITATFQDDRHFANAADVLDVDKRDLLHVIDTFQRGAAVSETLEMAGEDAPAAFTLTVRGRLRSSGQTFGPGQAADVFRLALAAPCPDPEPLLLWADREALCATDVDFHHLADEHRLTEAALYQMIERVSPRPLFAWSTHGRGLRLIYAALPPFTAAELAATAAFSVRGLDPLATVEIKADSRHPAYSVRDRHCGPVRELTPNADVEALAGWLGRKEVSEEEVAEWLGTRGLQVGGRYDHSHCPLAPHEPGNRQPVTVRANGIFCHVCSGRGVSRGHRVPGWFTFAALLGTAVPTHLSACLRGLTHWEHARFVLAECVELSPDVARAAYGAALKLLHGDDPRVRSVFAAGQNLLRFDRRWVTLGGEGVTKEPGPILESLPACQRVERSGRPVVDREMVARFLQPTDISCYGYPALTPVWGVKLFGQRLPLRDPHRIPIVLQRPELAPECMEPFRARYRKPAAREYTEEQAWAVLEEVFPDMNRVAVKLLVAAKGVAEGEVGMPPMVFLSGPSGSSKTGTILVAAAITGDSNHSVTWTSQVERVRQSLLEAKEQGSYVSFNEIVKDGKEAGKGLQKTIDFLLNLTPDSLSHKLYVGPVYLGSLPVCCFTDTTLPLEIRQSTQLARRLVHVHMPQRLAWEEALRTSGVGKFQHLRVADPRYAAACDTILSVVVDEFFQQPLTFEEVAGQLGYAKLEKSAEAEERLEQLKSFFAWVCKAPAAQGADARRWSGKGWKVIQRTDQTELADLWRQLADEDFAGSDRCNETDWAQLLGLQGPILFESRVHGGMKVAVRFVRRWSQKEYLVNEELSDGKLELATQPGPVCALRPGEPEHGEPPQDGLQGLSHPSIHAVVESRCEAGA